MPFSWTRLASSAIMQSHWLVIYTKLLFRSYMMSFLMSLSQTALSLRLHARLAHSLLQTHLQKMTRSLIAEMLSLFVIMISWMNEYRDYYKAGGINPWSCASLMLIDTLYSRHKTEVMSSNVTRDLLVIKQHFYFGRMNHDTTIKH